MKPGGRRLFSIGHSNHDLDHLVELLRHSGVTAVADVRSQPYSRWLPQFNGPELARALEERDLAYVFLGAQLGGRPRDANLFTDEGRADYEKIRQTASFQSGVEKLLEVLEWHQAAMLCAEEDPLDCHRGLMIAPEMASRGRETGHIRGDGSIESTADFEARLLEETGVGAGIINGLFAPLLDDEERRSLLLQAYLARARRVAFRLRDGTAE